MSDRKDIKIRFLFLIGFSLAGTLFIVAGTYLWTPLIIVGVLLIILGFFLADQ